jgi:hypothetical protein
MLRVLGRRELVSDESFPRSEMVLQGCPGDPMCDLQIVAALRVDRDSNTSSCRTLVHKLQRGLGMATLSNKAPESLRGLLADADVHPVSNRGSYVYDDFR